MDLRNRATQIIVTAASRTESLHLGQLAADETASRRADADSRARDRLLSLERLLRTATGGNLNAVIDRLRERDQLSLPDFAARCREGKDALVKQITQASADLFMQIEELELPATTKIELNTSAEGDAASWRALEDLSTGQKATAVLLLLLLLDSESPLVVDQPEDDLDNRFITDGVVPIMRQEKRRRQFIFSTHNANIPVLGDAELILGLGASGRAVKGKQ